MKPVNVFISYAHKDEAWRAKLQEHLASLGPDKFVRQWYDRRIPPGENWEKHIDNELQKADVILLLVSASFNNSGYVTGKEMKRALDRHKKKEAVVIPIILRPVVWDNQPYAKLQALPRSGRAITESSNRDRAFAEVTRGIRERILEFRQPSPSQLRGLPAEPQRPRSSRSTLEVVSIRSRPARRKTQNLRLTEKIGEGAFGAVWKAWNGDLERWEAVKIYKPEFAGDAAKRARFIRGMKAQARLKHPGIGAFYGYRMSPETLEVSMYLSEGMPLDQWVSQRTAPSFSEKIEVLTKTCEAVAYAHDRGVVHRDLKPSNVIVERTDAGIQPAIIDFDSAVLIDSASLTKTADHLGTLGFIAPEVIRKGAPLESRRSVLADIYSLGALAYFTLFRHKPVPSDLSTRAIDRKAARIQELDETRRQFLVNVLAKATAADPFERFESASELADALRLCVPGSELPDFDAELPFVKAVFESFDSKAAVLRSFGFLNRRFDEHDQVGRYTRLKEGFTATALYDFDMKEFAVGFSFPTNRVWRLFQDSTLSSALRSELGKALKFDPPNKYEEGGAYFRFDFTKAPGRNAEVTADYLVESLDRCLSVYSRNGF
jgi:serine/threonine protein kinase